MPEWPKAPRARVEDFVPWVSLVYSCPLASEEEEEENELADLVHNFGAQKCKRSANVKRAIGVTPEEDGEASQQPSGESSDVQAIVVSDSLEIGFHG